MRAVIIVLTLLAFRPAAASEGPYMAAVFGGVLTNNAFGEILLTPWDIEFVESYPVGVAGAVRVARPLEGLDIEIEGQFVKHFGNQTHVEANAPIVTARWTAMPWDEVLDTSAAFGIGLSFASGVPAQEVENEGASEQVMTYWVIELAFDLPKDDWELIGRLHHRSTAFGTFGDDGGSNGLVIGVRRRF